MQKGIAAGDSEGRRTLRERFKALLPLGSRTESADVNKVREMVDRVDLDHALEEARKSVFPEVVNAFIERVGDGGKTGLRLDWRIYYLVLIASGDTLLEIEKKRPEEARKAVGNADAAIKSIYAGNFMLFCETFLHYSFDHPSIERGKKFEYMVEKLHEIFTPEDVGRAYSARKNLDGYYIVRTAGIFGRKEYADKLFSLASEDNDWQALYYLLDSNVKSVADAAKARFEAMDVETARKLADDPHSGVNMKSILKLSGNDDVSAAVASSYLATVVKEGRNARSGVVYSLLGIFEAMRHSAADKWVDSLIKDRNSEELLGALLGSLPFEPAFGGGKSAIVGKVLDALVDADRIDLIRKQYHGAHYEPFKEMALEKVTAAGKKDELLGPVRLTKARKKAI
ncbi:Uncharacterised protein [uncultured archaeon]|nr:Uncharacterised protein [uncultured archaeon]